MREGSNDDQIITSAGRLLKLTLEEILQIAHSKLDTWSGVAEQPTVTIKKETVEVDPQIERIMPSPITLAEIPNLVAENVTSCINEEINSR